MKIYYLNIEAVPNKTNPESKECAGAYINFWIKASSPEEALSIAKEYIVEEDWTYVDTEDMGIAKRELLDNPDSLECYDEACEYGLGAVFYAWTSDEE
ncbi:MAG: hypothetical protein IJC50_09385 [Clostridia bacterium]|nr:hypothetical protein [Clostridia bacterium]